MTAFLRVADSPLGVLRSDVTAVKSGVSLHEMFGSESSSYDGPNDGVACFIGTERIETDQWKNKQIESGDLITVCPAIHGLDPFTLVIIAVVSIAAISLMSVPTVDLPGEIPSPADVYNVSAQGNRAKLGDPIPVRYGRFRIYPDFASMPYREFIGDDQYLYQLFSIGHGVYDYANIKIADNDILDFDDVSWEFYSPGQKITLFRDAVYVSPDVTNSSLLGPDESGDWVGPFIANEAGTVIEEVSVDIVFPQGLHYANEDGGLSSVSVDLRFEYREIDEFGAAIGSWTTLFLPSYTAATIDPIRKTVKASINVTSGRIEVRGKRLSDGPENFRYRSESNWTGLKGYLESTGTYNHSTWAVKVRATDQLSSLNDAKFNLEATRKLPIWNGSSWTALTATRNPAWAFCDAIKAIYGGDYSDSNLNLAEIKAVADTWDSRGDYYDGQFASKGTLWARLKQICLVGRAYPYQYAGIFTIIRDEPNSGPKYMFNGRNILADSSTVTYQVSDEFADDSVEIEYTDPVTWNKETITAAVPGSPSQKPKKIKWPFCTSRIQAHREAMFMAASQEYRNVQTTFKTELDGRVLDYLDPIMVVHDLPTWGRGGEVLDVQGNTVTLSEPVVFDGVGDHHIYFREDTGRSSTMFVCTAGPSPNQVVVTGTLPTIYTGNNKTKTFYVFSSSVSNHRSMLVDRVKSSGEYETTVSAVIDDPIVHSYDALIDAGTIVTPPPALPTPAKQFIISNLVAVQGGTLQDPQLQLSWSPADNADRYLVDVSYDAGASWTRVATVLNVSAVINVNFGIVDIRIAPQSSTIGLWFQIQVNVGSGYAVPPTPTGLSLVAPFTGIQVLVSWDDHVNAVSWLVEVVDPLSNVRYDEVVTSPSFQYSHAQAILHGITRDFDIQVYAINANGVSSVAAQSLTVKNEQSAAVTGLTATGVVDQIILTWNAVIEPDNIAYRVYGSNQEFPSGGQPLIDGNVTSLTFAHQVPVGETWWFTVAAVDAWGTDELNLAAQVSATTSKIVSTQIADNSIKTPHLQANIVTAAKMLITELSAITANLGSIVAGTMSTVSGTGTRVELSSSGNYPFWVGNGAKGQINGEVFYDKTTQTFTIKDPVSGLKFEFQLGSSLPMWLGTGNKTETNARLFVDDSGNIVAKGLEIRDASDNVVLSSGGTLDWGNVSNRPADTQIVNNLIDPTEWIPGTSGTQGNFVKNGTDAENNIVLDLGPDGVPQPIWVGGSDVGSDADGGWNTTTVPIDVNKTYRFSVYARPTSNGAFVSVGDGRLYLGLTNDVNVLNLSGTPNVNAYFINHPLLNNFNPDKWYLLIGYVFPHTHTDTVSYGGVYDAVTGERLIAGTSFKFDPLTTWITHRAYLFYSTNINVSCSWAKPRLEIVDGNEPSFQSMLIQDSVLNTTLYGDRRVTNANTESTVTTIANPEGGTFYTSGSVTGALVITLPQSWTNTMMRFQIDVYDYSTNNSFTAYVGGYNYSVGANWIRAFAQVVGNTSGNNRVRLGHDGTNCVVVIADESTVWEYPSVTVKNFVASYSNYDIDSWNSGWSVSIEDDLTGYTLPAGTDFSDALLDAKSISGQGALATQNYVNYGSVTGAKPPVDADNTASNTAAGIVGQGIFATAPQITSANISTYIASAAVGTLYLQGQAVTIPVSAITAGSTTPAYSWKTIQSVSMVNTGSPVFIFGSFVMTAQCSVYIRVRRDSVTVWSGRYSALPTFGGTLSISTMTTPSSGSHSYYLQVYVDSSLFIGVPLTYRTLLCLETKR